MGLKCSVHHLETAANTSQPRHSFLWISVDPYTASSKHQTAAPQGHCVWSHKHDKCISKQRKNHNLGLPCFTSCGDNHTFAQTCRQITKPTLTPQANNLKGMLCNCQNTEEEWCQRECCARIIEIKTH